MNTRVRLRHPRYEAGEELGRGAEGVVLRVVDREQPSHALVAKIWHEARFSETALVAEFTLLRRLDVPGLARAYDFDRDHESGAPFIVEDFVAGLTPSELMERAGERRADSLFQLLAELATTLAALHDAGFVHGDLKPAHVRITSEGRVFLLDLGAAVRSRGSASGALPLPFTPAFAAPERRAGGAATPLGDLYGLGALTWSVVVGGPPPVAPPPLRRVAPWVPPSLADVVDRLLAPHPRDRLPDALATLRTLGTSELANARRAAPAPVGRERELERLTEPRAAVRYVAGPSGVGKSHLLRELLTRALLAGRSARRVLFPNDDAVLVSKLVAFLRGSAAAWPFTMERGGDIPSLLVLDDVQSAPPELLAALEAYRCRAHFEDALDIVASLREAPATAEQVRLEALGAADFSELCRQLGVEGEPAQAELAQATGANPGWLVAARGRIPLTRDMVLARTEGASAAAREQLTFLALIGGFADPALLESDRPPLENESGAPLIELVACGLVTRRHAGGGDSYALCVPELAPEIAAALGSFEQADRAAERLLSAPAVGSRALLALASSPWSPRAREALLRRAAEAARKAGLEGEETDALLALAAAPELRSSELLRRLERLTRSAGINHPQVLDWLVAHGRTSADLRCLSLRREAERAARAGSFELAEQRAAEAIRSADEQGDRVGSALARGTRGAVALFRADVSYAESALRDARARLATLAVDDLEELARVDHNFGVVALYRDALSEAIDAFERSLAIKRRLGDRAGVRSCLLNLGLARAREGQHDVASETLREALSLARSLGQREGQAWCLAACADVEVRRKRPSDAERFIAEAESIAEAPKGVRADLALLRGEVALLRGDGPKARAALASLAPELLAEDAMLRARTLTLEACAALACLPAEPKLAQRLAIRAARAARNARLTEIERQALSLFSRARKRGPEPQNARYAPNVAEDEVDLWRWLEQSAAAPNPDATIIDLLNTLRTQSRAERVFLIGGSEHGRMQRAWGVDYEGFALEAALERCDAELVRSALSASGPLYERDFVTRAGRGSRLAIASAAAPLRAVLVFEHRFETGTFDALSSQSVQRFTVLAALALRLAAGAPAQAARSAAPAKLSSPPDFETSTALPLASKRRSFPQIIGSSRALEAALLRLDRAIDSPLPVLVLGETGTGKELFARALHELGARSRGPFVALNCAAVPEALFEAELFGHARGAFTGADRARPGLLARAEGGTLLLDEVGELPLSRQAVLLRVLETGHFRPVGSDEECASDVRIVAATHRELDKEVERGTFRQDLLYRLNVIEVRVPPLRERPEDISALVQAFLARARPTVTISDAAIACLEAQHWAGNVRELEHQLQRLRSLGLSRIEVSHLPRSFRSAARLRAPAAPPAVPLLSGAGASAAAGEQARHEVQQALAQHQGNITHAARALGLTRHGLKKRMLRLGLRQGGGE